MSHVQKRPLYAGILLSCLLTIQAAFANSQQSALVTICETALQTNDQGTIRSMASQMKNWKGLRDYSLIKRAEICLQEGLDAQYFYSEPTGKFEIRKTKSGYQNLTREIEKLYKDLLGLCFSLAKQTPKGARAACRL